MESAGFGLGRGSRNGLHSEGLVRCWLLEQSWHSPRFVRELWPSVVPREKGNGKSGLRIEEAAEERAGRPFGLAFKQGRLTSFV